MKRTNAGRRLEDGTKASNPKEAFGDAKMPLGLFPDTALVEGNLAFLEGALKYGQYNWRIAGVKSSTYNRALRRHLKKWWNGQNRDPITLVRELASVMACCAIIIDAELCGKLTDDRPPRADMEGCLKEAAKVAAHLKQLFKDHHPVQYTQEEHGAPRVLESGPIVPAGTGNVAMYSKAERQRRNRVKRRTAARPANVGTGIRKTSTALR